MAKTVDPRTADYDNDTLKGTDSDLELAKRDLNKDGKITAREEQEYSRRQRQRQVSTTVTTGDKSGRFRSVTQTPVGQEEKRMMSATDYGISGDFLKRYPDMEQFVRDAIMNDYQPEKFFAELEKTTFGQERTQAQEAFDIAIEGPQAEDLQKKVNDRVSQLRQEFIAAGIQVSEQELQRYGREIVRSDLSNQDILGFMSSQFALPGGAGRRDMAGTSATIYAELVKMAREYGLTMSDSTIQSKVRQAIQQGSNWQSWIEGQRNLFREQAKIQYPTLGDRFNDYTLEQLADPYLNDAADILGLQRQQLSFLDPTWLTALNGPSGPMSRDEWIRTLKTDSRYGWDRTTRARQEYVALADELMSVFGMA